MNEDNNFLGKILRENKQQGKKQIKKKTVRNNQTL